MEKYSLTTHLDQNSFFQVTFNSPVFENREIEIAIFSQILGKITKNLPGRLG